LACDRGPKTVTTDNGTFEVPGVAQTKAGSLVLTTMESGCEIPGGSTPLKLTDVKTKTVNGTKRTLFHVERTSCPAGFIDAALVYPAQAGAAR